ncbi:GNAT family N-acetyltransferase [Brevundimonas bacteroides]|uniref:GNAT family N-acetyltransferase n=1 Tax=Brevundimonas bacteroides TaxID=74311 RepID=UPI0004981985|nr:GNAT family N-acetyltransferase [Brevundimonas bacteroides]
MPELIWRPMTTDDLDGVCAVASVGFPEHFEDRDCFADRLSLHPQGCRVLSDGQSVVGYLIAYPSRRGSIPPLNSRLDALAADPDILYLHDLALRPEARGGGHARLAIEALIDQAKADGWPAIALVAVNDAQSFWARHGFVVDASPDARAKLATYGPDAVYMIRPL